jgi:glycosyltransferase involved in cell wall biosynthesis
MKIAILGIRGLPSSYSGYETFIGELAPRLVQRGHDVTIYCRSALFTERPPEHLGMKMRYLPSVEHKFLSTLSHTALSITDASLRGFDLILVVNAANGLFGFIPRVFGKKCVLNVDGMEWLRPKWNRLGKSFFKNSARLGTKFYNEIVTDADEMHRLYAREFGIDSTYIAYGANIETSQNPEVLKDYGVEPLGYYLIASRMIPDNNADLIVEAFVKSGSSKTLLIAGGADYKGNLIERAFLDKLKSLANERVKFTGHISKPGHVKELHCNCFAYVHGHQFGGINPSILKALGFGNLVLALNTPFNAEVLHNGKYGLLYEKNVASLAEKMKFAESNPVEMQQFRLLAPARIRERFTWEQITDQYEALFQKITSIKKDEAKN